MWLRRCMTFCSCARATTTATEARNTVLHRPSCTYAYACPDTTASSPLLTVGAVRIRRQSTAHTYILPCHTSAHLVHDERLARVHAREAERLAELAFTCGLEQVATARAQARRLALGVGLGRGHIVVCNRVPVRTGQRLLGQMLGLTAICTAV